MPVLRELASTHFPEANSIQIWGVGEGIPSPDPVCNVVDLLPEGSNTRGYTAVGNWPEGLEPICILNFSTIAN